MTDLSEREAMERAMGNTETALFRGGFRKGWSAAREYSKQREEVPTHFEWPERYEVGDVQTTACEIPLEGRSHTSYRKEVTCAACLQTMLAAALAENGDIS